MFYLHNKLKKHFLSETPLFDQLMALSGEEYRHQKGRSTQRVCLGDKNYFIKQHHGVGWKEIIKNIFQLRWPVLGAKNEWRALEKLLEMGIHAPQVFGYGERGLNPATRQSFVLMEEIEPAKSLEEITQQWRTMPPSFSDKTKWLYEVARISRLMHQHGMNHRDFYICHFLVHRNGTMYLIDLHRANIRCKIAQRWIIKDLAGLYFSSLGIGLTRHDWLRFIKAYRQASLKEIFKKESNFWNKVKARGARLYHNLG